MEIDLQRAIDLAKLFKFELDKSVERIIKYCIIIGSDKEIEKYSSLVKIR